MTENLLRNPDFTPLSKEDFVYETLREAIISGELTPGSRLVQTEIAERLDVSPIPVRSAIRRLSAEGLVVQKPHRPPRVSELSVKDLDEALTIRMYLEVLATKEAIPLVGSQELMELQDLVEQMTQALKDEAFHRYGVLNKAFHLRLYEACPNSLLKQMIRDLWDNTDRHRSRAMFSVVSGLAETSHQDHLQLLDLIEANNCDAAVKLMEEHKTRARELFIESLQESS